MSSWWPQAPFQLSDEPMDQSTQESKAGESMNSSTSGAPYSMDPVPGVPFAADPLLAAAMANPAASDDLRALINQKEKELREIHAYQAQTLQQGEKAKADELIRQKERYAKMKEDFDYNLKLLEERDDELQRYDTLFSNYKTVLVEKDNELSECKVAIADLESKLKQEIAKVSETEIFYTSQVKELQEQLETARWDKEGDLRKQQEKYEAIKRDLIRQLGDKEDQLENFRKDMTLEYEKVMREADTEYRSKEQELNEKYQDASRKVTKLTGELSELEAKHKQLIIELQAERESKLAAEAASRSSARELEDQLAQAQKEAKQAKEECQNLASKNKSLLEEHELKMTELLETLQAVDRETQQTNKGHKEAVEKLNREHAEKVKLVEQKTAYQVKSLEQSLQKLQDELDQEKIRSIQLEAEKNSILSAKDLEVNVVQVDRTASLQEKDNLIKELKWQRERENQNHNHKIEMLKTALDDRKEEITKLKAEILEKQEVVESVKREMTEQEFKCQKDLEHKDRLLEDLRAEKDELQELLAKLKEEKDASVSFQEKLRKELLAKGQEMDSLQLELKRAQKQAELSATEAENLRKDIQVQQELEQNRIREDQQRALRERTEQKLRQLQQAKELMEAEQADGPSSPRASKKSVQPDSPARSESSVSSNDSDLSVPSVPSPTLSDRLPGPPAMPGEISSGMSRSKPPMLNVRQPADKMYGSINAPMNASMGGTGGYGAFNAMRRPPVPFTPAFSDDLGPVSFPTTPAVLNSTQNFGMPSVGNGNMYYPNLASTAGSGVGVDLQAPYRYDSPQHPYAVDLENLKRELESVRARNIELEAQNSSIRQVVAEMRYEMEKIQARAVLQEESESSGDPLTIILERQVQQLRRHNDHLTKQIESMRRDQKAPVSNGEELKFLRQYVKELNEDLSKKIKEVMPPPPAPAVSPSDDEPDPLAASKKLLSKEIEDKLKKQEKVIKKQEKLLLENKKLLLERDRRLEELQGEWEKQKTALELKWENEHEMLEQARADLESARENWDIVKDRVEAENLKERDKLAVKMEKDIEKFKKELKEKAQLQNTFDKARYKRRINKVERSNRELREKLNDTSEELGRLVTEREKLMEISNMLKADLTKAVLSTGGRLSSSFVPEYVSYNSQVPASGDQSTTASMTTVLNSIDKLTGPAQALLAENIRIPSPTKPRPPSSQPEAKPVYVNHTGNVHVKKNPPTCVSLCARNLELIKHIHNIIVAVEENPYTSAGEAGRIKLRQIQENLMNLK